MHDSKNIMEDRVVRFALILLTLLLMASNACAMENGFYLGLNSGVSLAAGSAANTSAAGNFNLEYGPGFQGNLALGYHLGRTSPLGQGRLELELGYHRNPVDKVEFSDGKFSASGEASVWSLLLNSYGEYVTKRPWTPYVGGGIGMARLSLAGVEVGGTTVVDDSATVFAYQLGFGTDYELSKSLILDFGYRFFGTAKAELTDALGVAIDSEYQVHNLQIGLRF